MSLWSHKCAYPSMNELLDGVMRTILWLEILSFYSWRQTHHQVCKESLPPSSCIPTARYSSVNLLALCSFVICRNNELGPAVLFSQHTPKEFLGETFTLRAHSGITVFPLYNSLKGNSAQMSWIYWRKN